MFVYLITNTINGMRYVGQTTTSLEERFRLHKILNNCRYLHAALEKYGVDNFIIELICEPPTIELMNEFEAEYIIRYNTLVPNGYNLTEGGRVPRHNEATKEKMRLSHTGLKESEETKRKKSDALKGRKKSPEHVAKIRSLSMEQAEEIRRMYSTGVYSQTKLATMFSVSQPIVSEIIRRISYNF